MTKARMDSHSVIRRCFQITPVETQSTTWLNTSTGVEKKNGGINILPKIGTVENNCHSATATTATRSWSERRLNRDMSELLPPYLALLLAERADQAGRGLGVAV